MEPTNRVDDGWESVLGAYGTERLPFKIKDVDSAIAAVVEYGDYAEMEVWAVVRLTDGRFAYVEGNCDTTGWDCQSSCSGAVATSLDALYPLITDDGALRLYGVTRD